MSPPREPARIAAGPGVRIAVRDLRARYGAQPALAGVSLDVPACGVTVLLGPSGCGKSTLLRAMNRMTETARGAVVEGVVAIDGVDVMRRGTDVTRVRRRFGVIAQKPDPFPRSVRENVAYGLRLHRVAREPDAVEAMVRAALDRVGLLDELGGDLDQRGTSLSVGQQQRLCIARAIAYRPEILLADEPCAALDEAAGARIERALAELAATHTVVVATHRIDLARRVAAHAAYLEAGAIVESGPAAIVLDAPRDARTAAFLAHPAG